MRNCDGASTTFAPAGSGKLKCRKCGDLFSKQGAKRHRRAHEEKPVRTSFFIGGAFTKVEEIKTAYPGACLFVQCPYCKSHQGKLAPGSMMRCTLCNRHFKVGEPEPTRPLQKAQIRRVCQWDIVYCPHCNGRNAGDFVPGGIRCCDCGRMFQMVD